ncbi:thioredoxin domain-containing protein [Flavobacterium sp.]|uniref:thioredoxin domain-containing protein n=1 Tax=Flavobacterium sp. TaxID=239 RepID=UPI0037504E4E
MNELNQETSPYLLQHANNPVHWKAWNEKTLASAIQQNKLIIISVGYSACHWCHVMEHESFEDNEVAQTMNDYFINIKVDREERPDIDAVYMKAVQIMTSHGGWPMNVVCLPNGKPIWGGTYFKKHDWIHYLLQLQELYVSNPEKLIEYSLKLYDGLQAMSVIQNENETSQFNFENIELLLQKWQKSFDLEFGGMARSPKFMMPTNYEFLLRYGYQTKNQPLLDFVNLTLTKMAYGGLFDTIDGGFSRYSVDMKWHVPHFEKMLYDNGQLVSLYANAYKLTQNKLYKEVIEKTLSFVEKEFLTSEFGFYSALDADSLNAENHLEEGAFYVWIKLELQKILKEDFQLFSQVFNVNKFGFWENENYVLIQNQSLFEIALQNNISENELHKKKISWEKLLYNEREKRNKPRLDDKCLCSWNAIMLKGFIDGYKATQNEKYLEIALKNAAFIESKFLQPEGNLFHNYKNRSSTINGYLEDYCFVIDAFIGMYQITMNENWLQTARQLTSYCLDNFYDETTQFFRFTSIKDEALITTHFEIEDNVIPASNSVMANNLVVLSIYFNNSHYEKIAQQMLHHVLENIDYPSAFSNWLNVSLHFSDTNRELAITTKNALDYLQKINSLYLPNVIVAATNKISGLPFLENRFQENESLFYLCQNKTCELPSEDFNEIITSIFNN